MNDRIKELILQGVSFRLDPDSECYEAQICPEDLEYLVELVVQECIESLDENDGSLHHREFLLDYFGFEELKPCKSPYCECDIGKCTHPGFYDARGTE